MPLTFRLESLQKKRELFRPITVLKLVKMLDKYAKWRGRGDKRQSANRPWQDNSETWPPLLPAPSSFVPRGSFCPQGEASGGDNIAEHITVQLLAKANSNGEKYSF